jgi:hypothetical protein
MKGGDIEMDQQAMLYDDMKDVNNLHQAAEGLGLEDTADYMIDVYFYMGCLETEIVPMYQAYVRVLGE